MGSTPATLALYGRIYADSVGGLVAWRLGGIALALAGLMSILIVVRHTRAEEETGRAELVGAGVVGRHAPLAAALVAAAIASVALGLVVVLGVVSAGLAFTRRARARHGVRGGRAGLRRGRRRHRAGRRVRARRERARDRRARRRLRPAGDRRRRAARAGLVLAARLGAGDARLRRRALVAAGGAARARRARWWRGASRLSARRDLGAGLLPPRPGPARGALRTPLALAWRLQRGALAGWAVGFAILGAAFGSIAQDIGDVIGDSADVRDALVRLGGAESLVDAYLAATFGIMALIAAAFAVGSVLRLRGEETERPRRAAAGHGRLAHALGAQPRGRRARRDRRPDARRGRVRGRRARRPDRRRRPVPAAARRRAGAGPGGLGARRPHAGDLRPAAARDARGLGRARALPRAGRARAGGRAQPVGDRPLALRALARSCRAATFTAAPLWLAAIAAAAGRRRPRGPAAARHRRRARGTDARKLRL